jgi:hypothetical protein
MKFFSGLLFAMALTGAFMSQNVTADAGDMVTGYVAASLGDCASDSLVESHTMRELMCQPHDFPFSVINVTSQCPNYVDVVAYEYMAPLSPFASFVIMCIIFLSIISCVNTCLFGSARERESMGDMFIGVIIHSLVRGLRDDD